jgi:hypothetical protein
MEFSEYPSNWRLLTKGFCSYELVVLDRLVVSVLPTFARNTCSEKTRFRSTASGQSLESVRNTIGWRPLMSPVWRIVRAKQMLRGECVSSIETYLFVLKHVYLFPSIIDYCGRIQVSVRYIRSVFGLILELWFFVWGGGRFYGTDATMCV